MIRRLVVWQGSVYHLLRYIPAAIWERHSQFFGKSYRTLLKLREQLGYEKVVFFNVMRTSDYLGTGIIL